MGSNPENNNSSNPTISGAITYPRGNELSLVASPVQPRQPRNLQIQDDTADLHGVSQPVISQTCKKIAGIIAGMSRRFIRMPSTLEEQEVAIRKFRNIANFPTVIGAIDCTHIRVKKICADGGQLYINRKGFSSINVQGLLRFAMEATKAEDAPGNSELGPMDHERRQFLEEAMRSLTVDVAEVIQNAITVLTDQEKIKSIKADEPLPQDVVTSFSNLMEFIDDMDIANDFYKLGGFAVFPVCYSCEHAEVRANASWLLAEVCQNNPLCQSRALECGLLNVLLNLLHTEQGTGLAKCLYAVSCACREYEPSIRELIAQGGVAAVASALAAPAPSARTKAAFFTRYLLQHQPEAAEKLLDLNLVKLVTDQLKTGRDNTTEHLLGILSLLLDINDCRVVDQLRDPTLGLREALEDISKNEDERELCQDLLKRLFEDCPQYEIVSDEVER